MHDVMCCFDCYAASHFKYRSLTSITNLRILPGTPAFLLLFTLAYALNILGTLVHSFNALSLTPLLLWSSWQLWFDYLYDRHLEVQTTHCNALRV